MARKHRPRPQARTSFEGEGKLGVLETSFGIRFRPLTKNYVPAGVYSIRQDDEGYWCLKPQNFKNDESITVEDSIYSDIFKTAEEFWKNKDHFAELGLLHKRGILMWGPPGTGKSTIAAKIAQQNVENGGVSIYADCPYPTKLEGMLKDIRTIDSDINLVVIFEDLDGLLKSDEKSSYLNILDGGLAINNILFIATTNFPEFLETNITDRPSRFDDIICVKGLNENARYKYIESMLGKFPENSLDIETLTKDTSDMSLSHIKELVVSVCILKRDYAETLNRLKEMSNKLSSSSYNNSYKIGFGR